MKNSSLLFIVLWYTPCALAEFIVSGAEGMHADSTQPFEVALNVGPGWYTTTSVLCTPQNNNSPIVSLFKAYMKPFAALVGEITAQPHKNCFVNMNIGGGWLRDGTVLFMDRIGKTIVRKECARYKINFFNTNVTAGLRHELPKNISLETSLGYSYDTGTIVTAGPGKPNYGIFKYATTGPVFALGAGFSKNWFSFDATYSFILGNYKERDIDMIDNTTLFIRIPRVFVNHFDLVSEFEIHKQVSVGFVFSADFFNSHSTGITYLCPSIDAIKNPTVPRDTAITVLLLGFMAISF